MPNSPPRPSGQAQGPQAEGASYGSGFEPGPSARKYLGACEDTRKAWYSTSMLAKVRPERVHQLRQKLAAADVQGLASVLIEMSGPMHPGDVARARDAMTSSGAALASCVLQAVLPAVLPERRVQPDSGTSEDGRSGQQQLACLEELKRQIVFWIDHGWLDGPKQDARFEQPALIARYLQTQNPGLTAQEQSALRLACVAMTAPAIQSACVIARLPEGFIQSLGTASRAKSPSGTQRPESAGAIHRDEQDELDVKTALDAVTTNDAKEVVR